MDLSLLSSRRSGHISPEGSASQPRLFRHTAAYPLLVGHKKVEVVQQINAKRYEKAEAEQQQPDRDISVTTARRQIGKTSGDPSDPVRPIVPKSMADMIGLKDNTKTDSRYSDADQKATVCPRLMPGRKFWRGFALGPTSHDPPGNEAPASLPESWKLRLPETGAVSSSILSPHFFSWDEALCHVLPTSGCALMKYTRSATVSTFP